MKKKEQYPVGARWRAVDERGAIGEVWLAERDGKIEIWHWRCVRYSDGSGVRFDWRTTRRGAVEECCEYMTGPVRFKRVKLEQS